MKLYIWRAGRWSLLALRNINFSTSLPLVQSHHQAAGFPFDPGNPAWGGWESASLTWVGARRKFPALRHYCPCFLVLPQALCACQGHWPGRKSLAAAATITIS